MRPRGIWVCTGSEGTIAEKGSVNASLALPPTSLSAAFRSLGRSRLSHVSPEPIGGKAREEGPCLFESMLNQ